MIVATVAATVAIEKIEKLRNKREVEKLKNFNYKRDRVKIKRVLIIKFKENK